MTAQIALTLTLVVGAALFLRSLDALMAKGPGFTTSGLISFGVDSLLSGYSPAEGNRLMRRIDEAIRESSSHSVVGDSAVAIPDGRKLERSDDNPLPTRDTND